MLCIISFTVQRKMLYLRKIRQRDASTTELLQESSYEIWVRLPHLDNFCAFTSEPCVLTIAVIAITSRSTLLVNLASNEPFSQLHVVSTIWWPVCGLRTWNDHTNSSLAARHYFARYFKVAAMQKWERFAFICAKIFSSSASGSSAQHLGLYEHTQACS